jgi:hypothetical protein
VILAVEFSGDVLDMARAIQWTDVLGERGEAIAKLRLTDFPGPLFRPAFLGDKWPAVDCLVQLVGLGDRTPFFLAQVKATRKPPTRTGRLPVRISKEQVAALLAFPVPCYLIGVDERIEGSSGF